MTRLVARISDWWFASRPEDADRLAAIRIFVGTFALAWVVGRLGEIAAVARLPRFHFRPTGVTRLLDGPLPPSTVIAIAVITAAALVAFTVGLRFRWTGPVAAVGLLWTLTYRNSWGMIFHTENLLVLHVIVLAAAPSEHRFSLDSLRTGSDRFAPPAAGWALKLLLAITAVTYVLAAIAKLRLAGVAWLDGEQLRNQIAVDNLRKAVFGDSIAPLGTVFLEHPAGFTAFSVATIVLELAAPLVLVGTRLGRWWAVSAWGFHVGVVLLMNIWFPYPLLGLAYLPLIAAERPLYWIRDRRRKRLGMPPA